MLKIFLRDKEYAHPLADAKELARILAALPASNQARALDELAGWVESMTNAEGLTPAQSFDIIRQLDDAAQPVLKHLSRVFLAPSPRSPVEEKRLWKLCSDYFEHAAKAYQHVIEAYLLIENEKGKAKLVEAFRPSLPLVFCRQAAALIACAKWRRFHHEPPLIRSWAIMGRNFTLAEARKIDAEAVNLYPRSHITTTPRREFIKAVALDASSLDSLLPVQIEVAEKLVAYFSPQFLLSRENRTDNLYWIDTLLDQAPQRLARLPKSSPGVRLLGLGEVPEMLASVTHAVERGELPPALNLSGQYTPRLVLSVLRHLANYWTTKPPIRKYRRHAVVNRLLVQHGFEACFARMCGGAAATETEAEVDEFDFRPAGDAWQVGDVSMGGFGASVSGPKKDWLKVGALLVMQPEGADNWMMGVVRRVQRGADSRTSVGIQTMARQTTCIELTASGTAARGGVRERAMLIDHGEPEDGVRLVLPAALFDLRAAYSAEVGDRVCLLSPVELLESGAEYQLARFRIRYID